MKKIIAAISVLFICASAASIAVAGDDRFSVPRVAYVEPDNQTMVDLTNSDSLTFSWKSQPLPSGGRNSYRFKLYKGFGYDLVLSEAVNRDVFSIKVPADKFEDGATYTWRVQQRDDRNMIWSLFDSWSFKVLKKK